MRGLDNAEMLRTIAFLECCFSRVRPSCHLGATAFKRMHGRNIGTGCADLHPICFGSDRSVGGSNSMPPPLC
jgi:hypothetical protein